MFKQVYKTLKQRSITAMPATGANNETSMQTNTATPICRDKEFLLGMIDCYLPGNPEAAMTVLRQLATVKKFDADFLTYINCRISKISDDEIRNDCRSVLMTLWNQQATKSWNKQVKQLTSLKKSSQPLTAAGMFSPQDSATAKRNTATTPKVIRYRSASI